MSIIANTYQTYQMKGIREDLSDVIYNISPTETPFFSNAGRGKADNTFFEWQVDSLAATNTANQQIEGDDITAFDVSNPTTRLGNYTQISRKTLILADTDEAVDKAGRKSELAYQLAKKSKELKRDMEACMLVNLPAAAGATGTARVAGSVLAFIKTNTDKGAGGVDPVYTNVPNNARTDGTQRALTETQLKNVVQLAWVQGGSPDTVMVDGVNKQVVSGFSGIATKTFYQSKQTVSTIVGAADVYVSDFGTLTVVPNRFQRHRDVYVLDWDYWTIAYLRPFKQTPLAKTGDAEKRLLIVEFTLQGKNEAASGLIADIT